MPRKARIKSSEAIYHIMCRSSSEVQLFNDDEDKEYYLGLLKRYKEKYKCAIYAYCLMDNHCHLHFDGRGFDVSKFMHSLNTAYVRYYNKKYNRHGHLFQGRFESRIIDSEQYNLAVSAYIHNNPKDIGKYSGKEHFYPYSSYGIYLGIREDRHGLIDQNFIRSLFGVKNNSAFVKRYAEFVRCQRDISNMNEIIKMYPDGKQYEYISGKQIILRNLQPSKVLTCISNRLISSGKSIELLKFKYREQSYRAFCAYVMRVLCGMSYKEICNTIYNITISACARLCDQGFELVCAGGEYAQIFRELEIMAV